MKLFIGVDIGATKTQTLAVDDVGKALGLATLGPGATYTVGYEACTAVVNASLDEALGLAGAMRADVAGAGFGVSGYDWPHDLPPTIAALGRVGLTCPLSIHNDGDLPLAAGAREGWGVAVSAGTGNIVSGMNAQGGYARSTGGSVGCGELGGAMELVFLAIQAVAHEYTHRGPHTRITELMMAETGSMDILHLLSRVAPDHVEVPPSFATKVIEAAMEGDEVAIELLSRSGRDLGLTTVGIIRQIGVQGLGFEVVLSGSMFRQMAPCFVDPLQEAILAEAPGARFVPLETLPVVGGVILAMKKVGFDFRPYRDRIVQGANALATNG
jgi:N-acetylglucosamine kinase-like BadF-type ATPase